MRFKTERAGKGPWLRAFLRLLCQAHRNLETLDGGALPAFDPATPLPGAGSDPCAAFGAVAETAKRRKST
jgi:hypothetical protein